MANFNKAIPLFSLLLATLTLAPYAKSQVVDISDCRIIEDRLERFDCYEALNDPNTQNAPETTAEQLNKNAIPEASLIVLEQPVTETKQIVQEEALNKIDSVGRPKKVARTIEGTNNQVELLDTISSLKPRGHNRWLITLGSGQVWRQVLTKRYFLKEGDDVRIYPSGWGSSYRLTSDRISGFIQVERVH